MKTLTPSDPNLENFLIKEKIFLTEDNKNKFPIRNIHSFARRKGRITKRQKLALRNYWQKIGIEFNNRYLNFMSIFGNEMPVTLEIGFGMGNSLISLAKKYHERNFLGVEVYLPGIGSCLASAYEECIENLRLINYDAIEVLNKMIPDSSLSIVQLFFPDPWHKKRHEKRRIIQTSFAELVKSKLKIGGIFHIVTDWEPYFEHITKVISSIKGYKNQSRKNNYISCSSSRIPTKFELRGKRLGYIIRDSVFKRTE